MRRTLVFTLIFSTLRLISQDLPCKWEYVGPKSNAYQFKGLFTAVWVDEKDLNNVLAGSHTSGLFSTQNALSDKPVWKNITDNLPYMNFGISGIVVKKNTGNRDIYISTYTGGGILTRNFGNGILHTTNGGESWTHIGPSGKTDYDFPLQGIVSNPADQDQMAAFDRKDLYLTKDGWKTFSSIKLPFHTDVDNVEIVEVEYGPYDPGTIYVCTRTYIKNKSQIFVTHDGGITWKDITPSLIACERIALSTINDPKFKGKFYVTSGNSGIYLHYFNGKEFSKPLNDQPVIHMAASSFWCLELKVNQVDTSVIYLSLTETSMSTNGGKNFSKVTYYNGPNTHADVRDMVLVNDSKGGKGDKLFLGNDGGVSMSNDLFGSKIKFRSLNGEGLDANLFWGIDVLQSDSLFIAGGAQDNGGFFIRDGWETNNLGTCGDGYNGLVLNDSLAINLGNPPIMVLHNSNRNGNAYISIPDRFCEARRPLILRDSLVYTAYHDVWCVRVKDLVAGKYEFRNVSNISEVREAEDLKNREIKAMCISKYNTALVGYSNVLYAGPENKGKLYYCANVLAKKPVYKDISALNMMGPYEVCRWWYIESVAADEWDENTFYMIYKDPFDQKNSFIEKFVYDPDSNKAVVTNISYNLKKIGFNKVKVDEVSGTLYVATCDGVYCLHVMAGDTVWKSLNFSPKVIVSDVVFNRYTNKMYVATFGRGIWSSGIPSFGGYNVNIGRSLTTKKPLKVDGVLQLSARSTLTVNSKLIITKGSKVILKKKSHLVIVSKDKVRNEYNEIVDIEQFLVKHKTAKVSFLKK